MNCTRIYLFLICWGLSLASAQISFETPVMPSPTAAGLGKYGDIPVSHHTGVPNISIPIYTISDGPLGVPISLSYHGAGIRVDELASWVGLGWSLNAGGSITRTISGTPDEGGTSSSENPRESISERGWYQNYGMHASLKDPKCWTDPNQYYGIDAASNCFDYYQDVADGLLDSQPDIFTFNFGGYSGKFVFDYNRKPRIIPDQDLIIEPDYSPGNFNSWKIITPDGTKYFFGGANATEIGYSKRTNVPPSSTDQTSTTWYVHRIESMNGEHWIEFQYAAESYGFTNRVGHTVGFDCNGDEDGTIDHAPIQPSITSIDGRRLTSIITATGQNTIHFIESSNAREDVNAFGNFLMPNTSAKSLEEIQIIEGNKTRIFELTTSYFHSALNSAHGDYMSHMEDTKRLKLETIQETTPSIISSALPNPYIFIYNNVQMARRLSLARDHWGYYNGAVTNSGLIPSGIRNPCAAPGSPAYIFNGLANRTPSEFNMKAWSLEKIVYPTGGETIFEFEAHKYLSFDVGGLRIKQITTASGGGSTMTKNFVYPSSSPKLYGVSSLQNKVVDPDSYLYDNLTSAYSSSGYSGGTPNYEFYMLANPNPALRTTVGKHIGYSIVKVNDGANGETWYHYQNTISGSSNLFPIVPNQTSLIGGKLFRVEHYDAAGNSIKYDQYEYTQEDDGSLVGRVVRHVPVEMGNTSGGTTSGQASNVLYFRNYSIPLGRVLLKKHTSVIDGLETVTNYTYSDHHNQPIKTSIVNTDGKLHETETRFFDAWFTSACVIDTDPCVLTYGDAVHSIRLQYEIPIYSSTNPGATIGWTLDDDDVPAFQTALHQAQADYLTCIQAKMSTYDICRTDELDNFISPSPDVAILPDMIRRNLLAPLEVVQRVDGVSVEGSKLVYGIDNYPTADVPDHLVQKEYLRLINGNWSSEVNVMYDQHDNLIQYTNADGQPNSMLYSHDQRLPVASIANAAHNEIAYTSFEELPPPGYTPIFKDGNWIIERDVMGGYNATAQTGRRGFVLQPNYQVSIPEAQLPAGKYLVSFWYTNAAVEIEIQDGTVAPSDPTFSSSIISSFPGSSLTYFEAEIEVSAMGKVIITDANGGGAPTIDELRLYPIDAQMSTISYDYDYQVHTKTDVNNRSQYYQYDELGRLITVMDQDRNIVQTTDYYYKQ